MIIPYMTYQVIENKTPEVIGEHFGLPVYKKTYPSCYRYNVLVMLAKRLIKEEKEADNRLHLDRKIVKRIFSHEK